MITKMPNDKLLLEIAENLSSYRQRQRKSKVRKPYPQEVKGSILKLLEEGMSVTELSRRFGIGQSILYSWCCPPKARKRVNQQHVEIKPRVLTVEQERPKFQGVFFLLQVSGITLSLCRTGDKP